MSIDTFQKKFWEKNKSKRRYVSHPVIEYIFKNKSLKLYFLINDISVKSILDCGCGNGFFQTYLSHVFNVKCTGIDFSREMLRINPNPDIFQGSVTELPFKDNSFDLVTCHALLHHLPKLKQNMAISEMVRVSKHYIFIAEPNRNNPAMALFSLLKPEERGSLRFSLNYLRDICNQYDELKIIDLYIDTIILPNKTPLLLLPFMKLLDKPFLTSKIGFSVNILCKKISFP